MRKSLEAAWVALSIITACGYAAALAAETPSSVDGIKILQEETTSDIVVRPKLGLRASLTEINDCLDQAQKRHALTSVEMKEFSRRAQELREQLNGGNADLQTNMLISKNIYQLTQDINRGLQRTQQLAMYYCPDGSCPTTKEQLTFEYKQLKRDIKDAVANGALAPTDAAKFRTEAAALMRSTTDGGADNQQLAYVSKRFRKLNLHVQAVATAGRLSEKPASSSFLALPRAW